MKNFVKTFGTFLFFMLLCIPMQSCASGPAYYGADLGLMREATGIPADSHAAPDPGAPGIQENSGRDYLACIASSVNFYYLQHQRTLKYPDQESQERLFDDLNTFIPAGGALHPRGPDATRANWSLDYGTDPGGQVTGVDKEIGVNLYHQHVYRMSPGDATLNLALTLAKSKMPAIVFVNHGLHCVVVAGVWSNGPLTNPSDITALAVYNPWDVQANGKYLSNANYEKVPMQEWLKATNLRNPFTHDQVDPYQDVVTSWFARPYSNNRDSNGVELDPDPTTGPKAGQKIWSGGFVTIEPDGERASSDTVFQSQ